MLLLLLPTIGRFNVGCVELKCSCLYIFYGPILVFLGVSLLAKKHDKIIIAYKLLTKLVLIHVKLWECKYTQYAA